MRGIFNTVFRLREAIKTGNNEDIGRASALLDEDIARLSLARSDVGIRLQRVDALQISTEDRLTDLKSQESDARDVDYAQTHFRTQLSASCVQCELRITVQDGTKPPIFDYI